MQPIVGVTQGKVAGQEVDDVSSFLGIPYAAPISGSALFAAPGPPRHWDGVRDATSLGATVPKPGYVPPFDQLLAEPVISGAEPLNVNVWTPDPAGGGLPVLVWVHGGAFRNGSNAIPTYDGAAFARDGVVLVSLNYRLGAPGFAHLPDAPANRGILDQLAALAWVQDNIAAFGGDPARVTVCGESAGAMSVATLVSIAADRGLFQQAVMQSGAGHGVVTAADAQLIAAELGARLGVAPTAAELARIDVDRLIDAQQSVALDATRSPDPARWGKSVVDSMMAFPPVVDGDLLAERPIDAIQRGTGRDITMLAGTNTDEHRFFLGPVGVIDHLSEDMLRSVASARGWHPATIDTYAANRPGASPGDLLAAILTDSYFRAPAIQLADAHLAAGGRNYQYEFAWRSPAGGLGACHALDLPFVFDTLDATGGHNLTGPNPPQPLADAMHAAWVAFATTGEPGWPAYDRDRRTVQTFNHPTCGPVEDPRGDERSLWASR